MVSFALLGNDYTYVYICIGILSSPSGSNVFCLCRSQCCGGIPAGSWGRSTSEWSI